MTKYVLKATNSKGVMYYMNIIMMTPQIGDAKEYTSVAEAYKDKDHFEKMFYYGETPRVEVVEVGEE